MPSDGQPRPPHSRLWASGVCALWTASAPAERARTWSHESKDCACLPIPWLVVHGCCDRAYKRVASLHTGSLPCRSSGGSPFPASGGFKRRLHPLAAGPASAHSCPCLCGHSPYSGPCPAPSPMRKDACDSLGPPVTQDDLPGARALPEPHPWGPLCSVRSHILSAPWTGAWTALGAPLFS